jgi:hypothetical protein
MNQAFGVMNRLGREGMITMSPKRRSLYTVYLPDSHHTIPLTTPMF